ncbi:hypothetical protein [Nocardia puris]|uniref:hypothetical protein n=1 Tax=Nocardia puris TaxID=208602 RepID=UPI002E1F9545
MNITYLTECTTKTGTVRVGQHYYDNRDDNIRTLRVDRIVDTSYTRKVECTVIRQQYRGQLTEPMRITTMTPERLTSRVFVLVQERPAE